MIRKGLHKRFNACPCRHSSRRSLSKDEPSDPQPQAPPTQEAPVVGYPVSDTSNTQTEASATSTSCTPVLEFWKFKSATCPNTAKYHASKGCRVFKERPAETFAKPEYVGWEQLPDGRDYIDISDSQR